MWKDMESIAGMLTIRCIERRRRMMFITPFVGMQVEICGEFGLLL